MARGDNLKGLREKGETVQAAAMRRVEERGLARTDAAKAAFEAETALEEIGGVSVEVLQRVPLERRVMFCRELQRIPIVGKAARYAGLSIKTAYALREWDQQFALAWDEAMTHSVDDLEVIMIDRAKAKSDKLLETVMKAKRPEEYRERVEHAVAVGGTITVDLVPVVKREQAQDIDAEGVTELLEGEE